MQPRRGPRPTPAAAVRPRGPGAASRSGPGSPGPPHAGKRADPPSAVEKGAGRPAPLGGPATPPASLLCSAAGGQDAHWWGEEHARLQRGQTCCPSGKCSAMPPTPTPPLRAQRGRRAREGYKQTAAPLCGCCCCPANQARVSKQLNWEEACVGERATQGAGVRTCRRSHFQVCADWGLLSWARLLAGHSLGALLMWSPIVPQPANQLPPGDRSVTESA